MGIVVPVVTYMFTLLFALCTSTANACPPSDRTALLAFKSALDEQSLGIFKSWEGYDCCRGWYGISCDPNTHRVADINLRGESEDPIFERANKTGFMKGTISVEICKLQRLSSLTIADWKGINGQIPRCITTSLPFLRILDLVGNQISGTIPKNIGRLQRLTVLNLADNKLRGGIPASIVKLGRLTHLDLRNNQISGELPVQIGRLQMLSRALLSGNRITGQIPASIAEIYRLSDLDLSMNRMSGQIPDVFSRMPVLATLNLDGNLISGGIPLSLMRSGVSMLNLSKNALEGRIPDVFGPRSYFTVLDLAHNRLTGSIPKSMSSASFIGHLDISYNKLCGAIPNGPPFDRLEASSFEFNACLCGKPLPRRC